MTANVFRLASKLKLESLMKLALGVTAGCMLMGADADGCNPNTDPPPQPPTQEFCGPDEHLDLICEPDCGYNHDGPPEVSSSVGPDVPESVPEGCEAVCVPNSICPEGFYEELICEGWGYGGGPEPLPCLDENCTEPPPPPPPPCFDEPCTEPPPPPPNGEECYSVCVPVDLCGPAMHEEWICPEPVPVSTPPCPDPNCEEPPPPPQECFPICVPNEGECPPEAPAVMECDEFGCWETCFDPNQPPPPNEPSEPPPM